MIKEEQQINNSTDDSWYLKTIWKTKYPFISWIFQGRHKWWLELNLDQGHVEIENYFEWMN